MLAKNKIKKISKNKSIRYLKIFIKILNKTQFHKKLKKMNSEFEENRIKSSFIHQYKCKKCKNRWWGT